MNRGGTGKTDNRYSGTYLRLGLDYTLSESISSLPTGINSTISIAAATSPFDPDTDDLLWAAEFSNVGSSLGHAGVVNNLLSRLSINRNAATFTSADSALPLLVRTQIPKLGETKIPLYREILEDILSSALTFLFQTKDGKVSYGILGATVSGDIRDQNIILSGSQSVSFSYNDIYQTIRYFNRHAVIRVTQDTEVLETTDNKSTYLHGETRPIDFEHVLDDISTRIDAHLQIRSSRQAEYTYDIATEDIDTDLGTDVTIESDKITSSGTQNVKITSIRRSSDKIQVKATDLGELV